jgi:hypothetical protein
LREKLGEKTGIWSEDTIIGTDPSKNKYSTSRFKIDEDQIAKDEGVMKPIYDDTAPVQGGTGP